MLICFCRELRPMSIMRDEYANKDDVGNSDAEFQFEYTCKELKKLKDKMVYYNGGHLSFKHNEKAHLFYRVQCYVFQICY